MPWEADDDNSTDIGHDVRVAYTVEVPCDGDCSIVGHVTGESIDTVIRRDAADGHVVGLVFWHTDRLGDPCMNSLTFANVDSLQEGRTLSSNGHTLEQLVPLHVEASLLCKAIAADGQPCDFHGFVRDGRWVPA